MSTRKTILYIIDSLARGGAETMLVSPLDEIRKKYDVVIVTLVPDNVFSSEELCCDKIYCLNMNSRLEMFSAVKRLKRIIRDHNVTFVHSFLYWSSIVARLAISEKMPYVFSLATIMSSGLYKLNWYSGYTLLLERYTYKSTHFTISPTAEVLQDFLGATGFAGGNRVIPNFVKQEFFDAEKAYQPYRNTLKLVAVGNLKNVKNYQVLIDAFQLLNNYPVSLDIYGEGPERRMLEEQITRYALPITLKGNCDNVHEALPRYDAFVMCSHTEGFGISAAEAMAVGLPLLLSDLKVLREVSRENALFFDPFNMNTFVSVIKDIFDNKVDLEPLSNRAKEVAGKYYTKQNYLDSLFEVYDEVVNPATVSV